jgi:hypothetical protein
VSFSSGCGFSNRPSFHWGDRSMRARRADGLLAERGVAGEREPCDGDRHETSIQYRARTEALLLGAERPGRI